MNTLYSGKQQLFEKLERMLTGKIDEGEVSLLIDSLRVIKCWEILSYNHSSVWEPVEKKEQVLSISSLNKLLIWTFLSTWNISFGLLLKVFDA